MAPISFFTDPESFFAERSDDPSLLVPTLIVLATAVLAVVAVQPAADFMSQMVEKGIQEGMSTLEQPTPQGTATVQEIDPDTAAGFVGAFTKGLTTVVAFLSPLVGWTIYSLAFYAIASLAFDGTGSIGDTFAFVGWGFVPAALTRIVTGIGNFMVFGGVTVPDSQNEAMALQTSLQTDPILLATTLVGIGLLVWSGLLWTVGMEQLHDLDRRDAVVTIALPVGIALALRILDLMAFF